MAVAASMLLFLVQFVWCEQSAASAVGRDVSNSLRINSQASTFTAELVAHNLSVDSVRHSKRSPCALGV